MKKITLGMVLLCMSFFTFGQNIQETEAVKNAARELGYSEIEINNAISGKNIQSTTDLPTVIVDAESSRSVTPQFETASYNTPSGSPSGNIYGHDIFTGKTLNFIPNYNIPTPANYILGAGDEVIIDIWGNTSINYALTIVPEGNINVPSLGPVYLVGQTVSDAEHYLQKKFSQIYSGLTGDNPNTFIKVSLGKMRSLTINIVGEVSKPGTYTLPSLTTLCAAIYTAGGVTQIGTIRNIKLYRKSKLVTTFDVYDFIFNGDFSKNVRLEDNDLITVTPYNTVVSISGSVKRPKKYEMKDNQTINDLIKYSGDFNESAYTEKVNIVRKKGDMKVAYTISSNEFKSFTLIDGDEVTVASNINRFQNQVTISGAVFFPGDYAITDSTLNLSTLIKTAGGVRENAYLQEAFIKRIDEQWQPTSFTFSLHDVIEGSEDIKLIRYDSVFIKSIDDMDPDRVVSISGAVNKPAAVSYSEGLTLRSLILIANGLSENAYLDEAYINRIDENRQKTIIAFSLKDVMDDVNNDIILQGHDQVVIKTIEQLFPDQTISVTGRVNNPTTIIFRQGMKLGNVILEANGFADGATKTNIIISRRIFDEMVTKTPDTVAQNITINLIDHPELINFPLEPYDIVSVKKSPSYIRQQTVSIGGEVNFPGQYVVEQNTIRISEVVKKANGFTNDAYIKGATLSRMYTEEELQKQNTLLMLARRTIGDSLPVKRLQIGDRYSVGINLEKAMKVPYGDDDVVLLENDIVYVPKYNNTVNISGGVLYPNTITYNKSYSLKDYIRNSGGYIKGAAKNRTYVIYMNGTVSTKGNISIEPGCKIVVPVKVEKKEKMTAAQWIAMLTSTATLGAAIVSIVSILNVNK